MDLSDKVRLIIGNKCESPSQFADEIGIPRSGVSHLLNGRNKPSLDVITRIVHRYPDIGTDWIWDDNKMPVLNSDTSISELAGKGVEKAGESIYGKPLDLFSQPQPERKTVQKNVGPTKSEGNQNKVERVLLFFTDGTFREFVVSE